MSEEKRDLGDDRQLVALRGRVRTLEKTVKRLEKRLEGLVPADAPNVVSLLPSQEAISEAVQAELARMVAAAEKRAAQVAAAQDNEVIEFELSSSRRSRT